MSDLFEFADGAWYPAAPGFKDRDTSRAAAESVAGTAPLLRGRCLDAISSAPDGLTADQVASAVGESVLSVRPRITELLKTKAIRDAGTRRPNASGRSAKVWVVA